VVYCGRRGSLGLSGMVRLRIPGQDTNPDKSCLGEIGRRDIFSFAARVDHPKRGYFSHYLLTAHLLLSGWQAYNV